MSKDFCAMLKTRPLSSPLFYRHRHWKIDDPSHIYVISPCIPKDYYPLIFDIPEVVTLCYSPGLSDDLYSIGGDTVLSPYPLLPTIPPSQPVAKIYLEKQGGFSKTSVAAVPAVPTTTQGNASPRPHQTPLQLGINTQKVFRSFSIFCHGLLAGLASWQVFTVFLLHKDDLEFVSLYSPLSQPLQIIFYLLTTICTVSVCDR